MLSASISATPVAAAPAPHPATLLQIDWQVTRRGTVSLEAAADHRIRIQASAVTGTCEGKRFAYAAGELDLLPSGSSAQWHEDGDATAMILRFAPSLLLHAAEHLGVHSDRAGLAPRHQLRDPQIEHIAWALHADRQAGHPAGPMYAESLGQALAVHLLARHRSQAAPLQGLTKRQLQRVTEHIEAHLDQDLSMAQLAQVAGISASHLKSQFKRSTGLPVHAYVVRRRVERARGLLLRGDLSRSQIALEAGFSHQSHMLRCMRRVLGSEATALMGRQAH